MDELSIVYCTVPADGRADDLIGKLVTNRLASCVNVIEDLYSVYYWEDKVCRDEEKLLIIKTLKNKVNDVFDFIKENHPYSTPESISIAVADCGNDYLKWANDYLK